MCKGMREKEKEVGRERERDRRGVRQEELELTNEVKTRVKYVFSPSAYKISDIMMLCTNHSWPSLLACAIIFLVHIIECR